jgi:hypothetical protein
MTHPHSGPSSVLARLHTALEFDPIQDASEFVLMITLLSTQGGIPIARIARHIGNTDERIREWMRGTTLPDKAFWPVVINKIMSLILEVLRERQYK